MTTKKEQLLKLKENIGEIENIKKEDFRTFIDDNFNFEGCDVGYYLIPNQCKEGLTVHFNALDILSIYKEVENENYKNLIEKYGQEKIDRFEEILEKSDSDARYNNSYYVNFDEEYQQELIDILDEFYSKNEDEIDNNSLYEAREDIQKEALKIIEEELEELEEI